jgi:hypothetical protein
MAGITTPLTSPRVSSAKSTTAEVAPFLSMVVALSIRAWMAGFLDVAPTAKEWAVPKVETKRRERMFTVEVLKEQNTIYD